MDSIPLIDPRLQIVVKSEEGLLDEFIEDNESVWTRPDSSTIDWKAECGRILISTRGKYTVACNDCSDRFDGMGSFENHLKTVHYGIQKNDWTRVQIKEEVPLNDEILDKAVGTLDVKNRGKVVKNRGKLSPYSSSNPWKFVKITTDPIYDEKRLLCVTCDHQLASIQALRRHKRYHKEQLRKKGLIHLDHGGQEGVSHETVVKDELDIGDYEIQKAVYDGKSVGLDNSTGSHCNPSWDSSVAIKVETGMATVTDVASKRTNGATVNSDEKTLSKDSNRQNEIESDQRQTMKDSKARDSVKDDSKDFQCRFCYKQFENLTQRYQHEDSHANEKTPYRCSICPKSFTKGFSRKNHELSHRGDRPFRCLQCHKTFHTKTNFKYHVRRSRLCSRFKAQSYHNSLKFPRLKLVFSENPNYDEEKNFCLTCNRGFDSKRCFNIHKIAHMNLIHPKKATFLCELCPGKFMSESRLRDHIVVNHGDEVPKSFQNDPTYLNCRFCHKQFTTPIERYQHERSHRKEEKPYRCSFCPKSFIKNSERKSHESVHKKHEIYLAHVASLQGESTTKIEKMMRIKRKVVFSENPNFDDEKKFCFTCNRGFILRTSFNAHKYVHKKLINPKQPTYLCEFCPAKFVSDSGLRDHILANHGDEIPAFLKDDPTYLKCRYCHKQFEKPSKRYQHEKTHSKEKTPYRCPLCPKSFARNTTRKIHESVHKKPPPIKNMKVTPIRKVLFSENPNFDEEKQFCITCNREFASRNSFNKHKFLHRNLIKPDQRTFACELCPGKFMSDCRLRAHIVLNHGDEIPESLQNDPTYLQCRFCHQQFTKPTERFQHEKSHAEEKKPYQCTLCPKSFSRSSDCKVHISIHRGDRPFRCEECFQTFRRESYLKRHLKSLHFDRRPANVSVQVEDSNNIKKEDETK